MSMAIAVRNVSVAIESSPILTDISVEIATGERWAIIGRNGAGKSTLVRCMARLQPVTAGCVLADGRDIRSYRPRDLARVVAYVPQAQGRTIPYRVLDYVLMGRFAHQGFMASATADDHRTVRQSLEMTDTAHLAERTMDTLSGGELQRVLLAGAVSQRARILLLDEPTTYLDPLHRHSIQKALDRVHDETGAAMVTITHDVNAALTGSSRVL
ncbi:MAG: ATP-binding cassette domain-containing protein, partial [Chitinivibrionales bacterium]|nr:ATP-binding cassette domain-containing protein [Chitinivibrionales bacterium]